MRPAIPVLLVLTSTAFLGAPATADDFTCYSESYVTVSVADLAYVDIRAVYGVFDPADKFLFSVWIYRETNGEPGLQRGGPDDYCQESDDPDTLLY